MHGGMLTDDAQVFHTWIVVVIMANTTFNITITKMEDALEDFLAEACLSSTNDCADGRDARP